MLEFVVKYWVQSLFGAIIAALGVACRKIYKMYLNEKHHQKTKEQQEFYDGLKKLIVEGTEESRKGDACLQEQINIIKDGVLSIQSRNFKQECKDMLREGHVITLEEFENLQKDHNTYNGLGGNHDGDTIFNMVVKKATNDLTDHKNEKNGNQ